MYAVIDTAYNILYKYLSRLSNRLFWLIDAIYKIPLRTMNFVLMPIYFSFTDINGNKLKLRHSNRYLHFNDFFSWCNILIGHNDKTADDWFQIKICKNQNHMAEIDGEKNPIIHSFEKKKIRKYFSTCFVLVFVLFWRRKDANFCLFVIYLWFLKLFDRNDFFS